ncbi:MAG: GDP-mannose 4,6-dehydratase [Chloroflexi bacterium]|nr:GDP-mannose 4,6-dehydratase [Chloroflexota bacterium]
MKSLITGGAGFIGSHLAEYLLAQGHEVAVIDDLSTGRLENIAHLLDHPRFHLAIETITNEVVMDRLASDCDLIYHLAAAVGVKLIVQAPVHTIETNIMGTAAVFRAANRYRRPVVLASTSEIYGKSERVPFAEDDDRVLGPTTRSRWCYAASKAVDEFLALAYAKEYGLPVVIVRLFNTIGPRQTGRYGMVVPRFVAQALAGEPLTVYGDGTQTRCFADVRDIVRGMVALAECPQARGQVFNLGSDREISIADLARLVIDITGSRSKIVYIPYEQAYEAGFEDMPRRVPDVSKVKAWIGWEATIPLEESIRAIVASMKP